MILRAFRQDRTIEVHSMGGASGCKGGLLRGRRPAFCILNGGCFALWRSYTGWMLIFTRKRSNEFHVVETTVTRHAELLVLCARIGYSPPNLA